MSVEFSLEDEYNPTRSYGSNIVDMVYFNMNTTSADSYIVFEIIIKRRSFLTGE